MSLKLRLGAGSGHAVSEMILGHNLEMCLTTADGLLSDRLRNPKFLGPPHPMTGIAPHWLGSSFGNAACELTPFAGMAGKEAQLVRVLQPSGARHLLQNKLQVRAGETLELEIWARAWHAPVTLKAVLLPLSSGASAYDSGEIVVDKPYYQRHTLPLRAGRDDNEARLSLNIAGHGELWIDQIHLRPKDEPLLCKAVVQTMKAMRIPSLRFPGGIISNAYHWRHGTGPVHLRPAALDAAFHHDWYLNYDFGLDEYLRLCLDQNIVPALTFNIATGTPEEAAEMAAYCAEWFRQAGVEAPRIYWHVGNHPYSQDTSHMTPAMYAGVLKAFVPGVKAAYPNSRIVAVMGDAFEAEPEKAPWRETLFAVAADLIDVVEVQIYGGCNPLAAPEEQVCKLAESLANVEPNLRAFIKLCRSRHVRWNVGIAEWNWWMQASHWDGRAFEEPPTVLHGLYIAGMIRRFAALGPDFEVAHFYNLVNCMGILNHRGADVEVTDAVGIFNLYRPALPGRFLPLNITGDAAGEVEAVEALGLENSEGRWLFLTNRSPVESAQVSLTGLAGNGANGVGFCGDAPTGRFNKRNLKLAGDTAEIPPLSVWRIRL